MSAHFDHTHPVAGGCGVYAITCAKDGKVYIGSSINIRKRTMVHRRELIAGKHTNEHLQRAFSAHGGAAFTFSVVELCGEGALMDREQHHIDARRSHIRDYGYNLCPSAAGREVSDETRAKLRSAVVGVKRGPLSDEHKAKLRAAHLGKKMPAHVLANLVAINRSRKRTPEHCAALSAARMGHPVSAETREKLSLAHRGRSASVETRAKMSTSRTGLPHPHIRRPTSPETRAKIAAALTGRTISEETRMKISATLLTSENRERLRAGRLGKKHSLQTREKMSVDRVGRPGVSPSAETRAKISAAKLGKPGISRSSGMLGKKHSAETIERMRISAIAKCAERRAQAVVR